MKKNFDLESRISSSVSKVSAYVPGEQPQDTGWIKLNTNEFPYPPSPKVKEAILAEVGADAGNLRLYPDPLSTKLRSSIAKHFGVNSDCVMAANGSDDALNIVIRAFTDSQKSIATFDPSYSLYPVLAKIQGAKFINIAFKENLEIDYDALYASGANIFFFTNPNAPTGKGFDVKTIEKLCTEFDGLVLVDEAYAPFADFSAAKLIEKYPNLIVTGTSSKGWGLAGMRVGWAIAQPQVLEILDRVRDSYNLDRLAQVAGTAAIDDNYYHLSKCSDIKLIRRITQAFFDSIGWTYIHSCANFILFTPQDKNGKTGAPIAAEFVEYLRSQKILVRYFAKEAAVNMSIRLTIGTREQMESFFKATQKWKDR